MDDKKYGFVFNEEVTRKAEYLHQFVARIMGNDSYRNMLVIIIGIVSRLIFDIKFWMTPARCEVRHPLALVCDETYIYGKNERDREEIP